MRLRSNRLGTTCVSGSLVPRSQWQAWGDFPVLESRSKRIEHLTSTQATRRKATDASTTNLPGSFPDFATPAGLAILQRFAGNRAVEHMLQEHPNVQRCGPVPCSCSDDELAVTAPPTVQRQPAKVTQAQETAFAVNNPGMVTNVGDTTGGGGGLGQRDPNEFVLWNYLVGKADLRAGHRAQIDPVAARWRPLLGGDPSLRVKIVGSASKSGGAGMNTSLARRRAEVLKQFLVARGIRAAAVETIGEGSRLPLADDRTAAGLARNRRVEMYLIRPTTVVDALASASADVISESVRIGSTFDRTVDPGGFVAIRHRSMQASARVSGFGGPGSAVGYLQLVQHDERIGRYRPAGGGNLISLDYSRCTRPYLPCKDVPEATAAFSSQPLALQPAPVKTIGTVSVVDSPGVVFPIDVTDPVAARLEELQWSMEFVTVLGVRSGDQFMALHHFIWRLDVTHTGAAGSAPTTSQAAKLVAGAVPGAPASLDIGAAMSLQTCRFTMRRIEATGAGPDKEMCQPQLG